MTAPKVYKAINAVAAELARNGIPKANTHLIERYEYRSIDDVLNRLSPLLAKHRLCVLPRALERVRLEVYTPDGPSMWSVSLRIAFDLISVQDASLHTVEAYGEALDEGDKATSKAMSSAYKIAMLQTFCVPVQGLEDIDTPQLKPVKSDHEPAPVQGWDQWAADIKEIVTNCASGDAITRVQRTYRSLLKAISRERPDLYRSIGATVGSSAGKLARSGKSAASPKKNAGKAIVTMAKHDVPELALSND